MNSTKKASLDRIKYENLILALLEQQAGIDSPRSYPIAAYIAPSNACNLKCKFCLHSREIFIHLELRQN